MWPTARATSTSSFAWRRISARAFWCEYRPIGWPPRPLVNRRSTGPPYRHPKGPCRNTLACRWFCKLGIEDAVPDHSAFSRARNERFRDGDVLRRVFYRIVETCNAADLVGGEGFAVDASLIASDANKQRSIAGQDWRRDRDPARSSRAVKEYLATLDDPAWGAASDVVPKFVSPSDPAAQWTGAHKGPAFFAYSRQLSHRREVRRHR